jgi:Skp family chaperone for outer membrane proteins
VNRWKVPGEQRKKKKELAEREKDKKKRERAKMLGIRPDSDQFYLSHTAKRSSSFANRYTGRFFVSGVSGSFAKYSKERDGGEGGEGERVRQNKLEREKYTYQPVLERNQRKELQADALRLLELEEKLQEIQRIKAKKRERDRQRRRRKLEFQSVLKLQRWIRRIRNRKYSQAIDVVKDFLKAIQAQQAVYVMNWALSVLKRFAKKVS